MRSDASETRIQTEYYYTTGALTVRTTWKPQFSTDVSPWAMTTTWQTPRPLPRPLHSAVPLPPFFFWSTCHNASLCHKTGYGAQTKNICQIKNLKFTGIYHVWGMVICITPRIFRVAENNVVLRRDGAHVQLDAKPRRRAHKVDPDYCSSVSEVRSSLYGPQSGDSTSIIPSWKLGIREARNGGGMSHSPRAYQLLRGSSCLPCACGCEYRLRLFTLASLKLPSTSCTTW